MDLDDPVCQSSHAAHCKYRIYFFQGLIPLVELVPAPFLLVSELPFARDRIALMNTIEYPVCKSQFRYNKYISKL
ncbi:hypothetical protein N7494_006773 [Penicillium frequentans]|uniref:Uncharacterized protein n=1 Tax=Penicillium frequentans TaxID=3151616 RepID=A0AAD6GEV7_9EURO|nr:hypothetical protein N7494_006773 [Penicillium glabrum]